MSQRALLIAFSIFAQSAASTTPRSAATRISNSKVGRRDFATLGVTAGTLAVLGGDLGAAQAAAPRTVLVAGATGKTGRLVCRLLCEHGEVNVLAGVRNEPKARELGLLCASTKHLDVTESVEQIAASLAGVDSVVCALGFAPGNPFKYNEAAHAIDNVGTVKLIDACKAAKVQQLVLVSSILTDGRAWGQENSPGFKITNAFGAVLDEKLVAEKYLRDSGLAYVIVRPGGLRDKVEGEITISGPNTLNSGEVARASVAQVCVQALFTADAAKIKSIVEVIETEKGTPPSAWFA
jgi:uncharacterized protein YbjT (DUF2867 family)